LEKQHLKNRQDSTTWDIDDSLTNSKGKPFPHAAFPVPKYDLAGKFRYHGACANANFKNYFNKKFVYSFFLQIKQRQTKFD